MTAEELDGQGLPEVKPCWGCGCVFMLGSILYGVYRLILWLSTQAS